MESFPIWIVYTLAYIGGVSLAIAVFGGAAKLYGWRDPVPEFGYPAKANSGSEFRSIRPQAFVAFKFGIGRQVCTSDGTIGRVVALQCRENGGRRACVRYGIAGYEISQWFDEDDLAAPGDAGALRRSLSARGT